MLVQKIQDIEEYNIGFLLGEPDIGVRVKRFTNRKVGEDYFTSNFSLEYYSVEPGKAYPVPNQGSNMIYILQSGNVCFEGEVARVFAGAGEIVYARLGEISSVRNSGAKTAEILCCADTKTNRTTNQGI
jgi:hypothetical protein